MLRSYRALCALAVAALSALLLGSASLAQSNERCFTATNHCIGGRFLQFWDQHGGLAVFGYPLSGEMQAGGQAVQYFERQRFELHPENATPYDVLLGRLGVEVLARNGIDWQSQATSPGAVAGCRWFPETQHNVCDQQAGNGFLSAWSQHGLEFDGQRGTSYAESLALFGVPITEAYQATIDGQLVQVMWFERARFEWHPNNPAEYRVLFGRLGAEIQGAPLAVPLPGSQPPPTVPLIGTTWQLNTYGTIAQPQAAVGDAPATLRFGGDGQASGNTGCNGFSGSYTATAEQLTFGQLISTLRACADPVGGQEREVLAALQGTRHYQLTADTLQIAYNQDQSLLIYKAVPATTATVTGTVTYLERIALPPDAIVTVRLLDISRQDVAATVLAEQVIATNGQQVPFTFTLTYDPAKIDLGGIYGVRAEISSGGQLLFTTTDAYLVITQGRPTHVEVVVHSV
jgi:uncharacterized lipoprotein YbaY